MNFEEFLLIVIGLLIGVIFIIAVKKKQDIKVTEDNLMDNILKTVVGYGKRNKFNLDKSKDSYNEFRTLEKDGLKIKVSVSKAKKEEQSKYNYPKRNSNYRNNNYGSKYKERSK